MLGLVFLGLIQPRLKENKINMHFRDVHHKQKEINSLTDIFQLTQVAVCVAVPLNVWTPDCYAHTGLSGRWQNKLPSSKMCGCLSACVCI